MLQLKTEQAKLTDDDFVIREIARICLTDPEIFAHVSRVMDLDPLEIADVQYRLEAWSNQPDAEASPG